jgi:hypothetical protein
VETIVEFVRVLIGFLSEFRGVCCVEFSLSFAKEEKQNEVREVVFLFCPLANSKQKKIQFPCSTFLIFWTDSM